MTIELFFQVNLSGMYILIIFIVEGISTLKRKGRPCAQPWEIQGQVGKNNRMID